VAQILNQLKTFWAALDDSRQRQLLFAVAAAVFTVVGVAIWAIQPSFSPVLSGHSYDELLQAAGALDEQEVPYRLKNGALEVPSEHLGRAKAAISAANVLPGLSDVEDLSLGLTPQAQKWAFLRAKEGDIARMINGIKGISASQINIVPQQSTLFFEEESPASASVFIKMRPGASLSSAQTRAIVNLVAQSVEGLSSEHVTVADDKGRLLAAGTGTNKKGIEDGATPGDMLGYKAEFENQLESAVSQALMPVLGSTTDFSVTASVHLDMNSKETVTKRILTEQPAVISEVLEESDSSKPNTSGVPGVDANLPERNFPANKAQENSSTSSTTTNYLYPTVDEVSRTPAGSIQRISVAVQVNMNRIKELASPDEETGKTADTLQQEIRQVVQASVGYDETRKDIVTVSFLPFASPRWVEGTNEQDILSQPSRYMPYLLAGMSLILLFAFLVRPLVGSVTRTASAAERVLAAQQRTALADDSNLGSRMRYLVDNFQIDDLKTSQQLNELVKREAESAAHVMRKWTTEVS
jgi:flagellar M-ring protein FliF